MSSSIYQFGEFTLDCGRFELSRAGRVLKLEKKPMELLVLLASSNGCLVTRTEIAARLWEREVFVDTEHGINTAIRKVRHALRDDPDRPKYIQTVTGKGYRFIAPVIESLAQTAEESAAPVLTPPVPEFVQPSRNRHLVIFSTVAASVVIASIVLTARSFGNQFHHSEAIKSLAVLPLDNLSGDRGQDYFADGMTDELITMLTKNSTLRIVSRTSAMQYKQAHRPLPEIARGLGVDGILEGSVARSNNQVHMTVQLIDARTDTHVWADSFDCNINDTASLSSEVAQSIARQLRSAVPQPAPSRYVRPDAHDAYLHGRYLWFTSHNEEAGEYFRKATELQPDYALAWSGMADYYAVGAVDGLMNPKDSLWRAEVAARKAVSLDDSLAQTHLSLCAVMFFSDWNWPQALQECSRALELDPELAEAYHLRAKILATLNRHAEAIQSERKSMELNPFARPWGLVLELNWARQYDAAISDARARLESMPTDVRLMWGLAYAYRCKGMENEAVPLWEKAFRLSGDSADAAQTAEAFRRGGYSAVIQCQLDRWKKQAEHRYVSPVYLARLTSRLGEREQTLTLLEQGYEERSPLLLEVQFDPSFDFLHRDERYRSIVKRMGLAPAY